MFFGYELLLFLYFPVLLLGTRSIEIEALGTALEVLKGLEVLEVDVLEDGAIFDLRPEGPSGLSHKRGGLRRISVSQICTGPGPGVCRTIFDHGP